MNLSTVEIPTVGARKAAADYMRVARQERDPGRRREFEEIATAYRYAARAGVQLIALTPTVAAGGTVTRTLVRYKGSAYERRSEYLLPMLAVARWDAAFVYTGGVQTDGSVELIDSLGRARHYRKGAVKLDTGFALPSGYESGYDRPRSGWSAMVPIVPPKHRPGRGMGDRLVLFEVADWTWATLPTPPGDPALLRHVGGDLYAVEATWDLTELERLVLSGRRPG